jgi:hypothetical protein
VSYLPELRSHLDRLLVDRERVLAATELEAWARTEAAPSDTEIEIEIDKVRALIRRVEHHVDELTSEERDQITEAVEVLRTTRQVVSLGMPTRPPRPGDQGDVRAVGRTTP